MNTDIITPILPYQELLSAFQELMDRGFEGYEGARNAAAYMERHGRVGSSRSICLTSDGQIQTSRDPGHNERLVSLDEFFIELTGAPYHNTPVTFGGYNNEY